MTLRASQIKVIAARGRRGEKVASLARNPNTFLAAVQIGVTVAGFAYAAAPVLNGFATLMRPIIWMLSQSTNVVVRLPGGDPKKAGEGTTEEESRDIYEAIAENPSEPLRDIVRAIPYLPATARVLPTLTMMRAEGQQIAVIIDEYGGTDGIATLEDLVEEVVGGDLRRIRH